MGPQQKPPRRRTSKQPPAGGKPTRPAVEGSHLQRKQDCVSALKESGSDRPTAAYNGLAERNADKLQAEYDQHKGNAKKLGAALIRLCATHKVAYTRDYFERNKDKRTGPTKGNTPSARLQPADTPFVSLDPQFFAVPVTAEPITSDDGLTYKDGISLHTFDEGERILQQILGAGKRPDAALAIAVIGPKNDHYVGTEVAVPILKRHPQAQKAIATHVPVTLYQLGRKAVRSTQKVGTAALDPADHVCWIRVTMHEAEVIAAVPSMHSAFEDQFSGGAPIKGGPRARAPFATDGKSKAQDRARQNHKESKKDQRRQELDVALQDTFKALFHNNFRSVTILEPCKSMTRYGSGVGKRSLAATFGVSLQAADKVLAASGQIGATYDLSNVGADEPTADKYQIVWFPDDAQPTMAEAYQKSVELKALGVVRHAKSNHLGIRVTRDTDTAKAVAKAIRGSDATLAKERYRITGIASKHATMTQIAKALQGINWDCEVYHTAWDKPTAAHFALVRAHQPPAETTLTVPHCAIPWSIVAAPLTSVTPKGEAYSIVPPDAINDTTAAGTGGGGFSPTPGSASFLTKASKSPHLHDLLHATPKGKATTPTKEEPPHKRARPASKPRRATSAPHASGTGAAAEAPGASHAASPGASASSAPADAAAAAPSTPAPPFGMAEAVPGDHPEGPDVVILSDSSEYDEDADEFQDAEAPPPTQSEAAQFVRMTLMESQHNQLAATVDSMQTQLTDVLANQSQIAVHVEGLERGIANASASTNNEITGLRGEIQALLGHLVGGIPTATPQPSANTGVDPYIDYTTAVPTHHGPPHVADPSAATGGMKEEPAKGHAKGKGSSVAESPY